MAGKFPITYSQAVPSGEVAQVPFSAPTVDVRTGAVEAAQSYAQSGSALANLGKDLMNFAMKVQDQKDSLEFSRTKRQIEEARFAAYNTIKGDYTVDTKTLENMDMRIGKIIQSKNRRLHAPLEKYVNETAPNWNNNYKVHSLAVEKENADKEFELEQEKLLGDGNLVGYYVLVNNRWILESITTAERDVLIDRAENDSIVQQMRVAIGENRLEDAFALAEQMDEKTAKPDQLDSRRKYLTMAKQVAQANTDTVQNEITFDMFNNRDKMLSERAELGQQYITRLQSTPGLSAESARVMTNRIEEWMTGKDRINNSLIYTGLYRKVTRLHRGLEDTAAVRKEIVANFDNLDDTHFESLNQYLEQTVEEWNADTMRRLEKEAQKQLAPRLSMLESLMAMSTIGMTSEQLKRHNKFIERLQEPAKLDADRLALYNERIRNWSNKNPDSPALYENGRRILAEFERYDDAQIRQMERELATYKPELVLAEPEEQSPFADYPDAYKEGDNWYVIRNGKRYRIEP